MFESREANHVDGAYGLAKTSYNVSIFPRLTLVPVQDHGGRRE